MAFLALSTKVGSTIDNLSQSPGAFDGLWIFLQTLTAFTKVNQG